MGNVNQFSFVNSYYAQYLELINNYKDITRHSLFCIYYNINKDISVFNERIDANYTSNHNGIVFDKYQMTPVYKISEESNNIEEDKNVAGLKYTGEITIVTYTIQNPNLNDLVVFPYKNQSDSIYRVKDINIVRNMERQHRNIFHELTLEYAPIKDLTSIKINFDRVYYTNDGVYLLKDNYIQFIDSVAKLETLLKNHKFDNTLELYYYLNDENNKIYNIQENELIYNFIQKHKHLINYFVNSPYGILKNNSDIIIDNSDTEICKIINQLLILFF